MGGVPPSHNTVMLLCAISFLLNHDPDLRIFPEIAGGLFHFKKDNAQYNLKPDDYATKPLFVASKDDNRISGVCDDQYTATLEGKTQGWFWRWGCPCTSDTAASPAPGAAPGGASALMLAWPPPPPPAALGLRRRRCHLPRPWRRPRRRWGFDTCTAASPAPGAAPGGAGTSTQPWQPAIIHSEV